MAERLPAKAFDGKAEEAIAWAKGYAQCADFAALLPGRLASLVDDLKADAAQIARSNKQALTRRRLRQAQAAAANAAADRAHDADG